MLDAGIVRKLERETVIITRRDLDLATHEELDILEGLEDLLPDVQVWRTQGFMDEVGGYRYRARVPVITTLAGKEADRA